MFFKVENEETRTILLYVFVAEFDQWSEILVSKETIFIC